MAWNYKNIRVIGIEFYPEDPEHSARAQGTSDCRVNLTIALMLGEVSQKHSLAMKSNEPMFFKES